MLESPAPVFSPFPIFSSLFSRDLASLCCRLLMTAIRGKEAVHPLVGTMPAILVKCSYAINPLIYVATNTQFRREFKKNAYVEGGQLEKETVP